MTESSFPAYADYDLEHVSAQFYRTRTVPLRVALIVLAIGFALGSVVLLLKNGANSLTVSLSVVTLGFVACVVVLSRFVFVQGPKAIRLTPGRVEFVYPSGRVRELRFKGPGTRIQLTDLSALEGANRPGAINGPSCFLEVNGGRLIALTPEALGALQVFLVNEGMKVTYDGIYRTIPGSHLWRFAS